MRLTPSIVRVMLGLLLAGVVSAAEPLLRPAPDAASWRKIFDSMKAPVPPRHLVGNIYYVGASGVSSYLITTPQGHILIDTGFADTVPLIERSVEQLGFKVSDIKIILSSHAHVDHTGGHALMKQLTHAMVCASAADAQVLESGGADDFIPGPKSATTYAPVKVDRVIADGERVTLGDVTLTAHLTPGHTRGATTWTMDASDGGRTYHVVFFCSLTINPGVRLVRSPSYPEIVADYESTLKKLRALPCDIFFAPHGAQFGMADKFARLDRGDGAAVLVDPAGWHAVLDAGEKAFRDQLAAEQAASP
ncbi:MAG TPA: subclass B3 metallo-beta-lactamase [Candidatus Didemnitutus sp.]|nr:subclass B3 metallo-beta-lactamase [Candidatus Didemnitutus sp.]